MDNTLFCIYPRNDRKEEVEEVVEQLSASNVYESTSSRVMTFPTSLETLEEEIRSIIAQFTPDQVHLASECKCALTRVVLVFNIS